jgi:hypothetical protein
VIDGTDRDKRDIRFFCHLARDAQHITRGSISIDKNHHLRGFSFALRLQNPRGCFA